MSYYYLFLPYRSLEFLCIAHHDLFGKESYKTLVVKRRL